MKSSFSSLTVPAKLLILLFFILSSFLLTVLISFVLAIPIFGVNLFTNPEVLHLYTDPDYISLHKFLQISQAIGIFILPSILAAYTFRTPGASFFHSGRKVHIYSLVVSGLVFILAMPLIGNLIEYNQQIQLPDFMRGIENWMIKQEESRKALTEAFLNSTELKQFLLNLLLFGIVASIGEEMMFRGVVQRLFTDWAKNVHWGVIISALLFSTFHFQFYGFIPRFLMGLYLGYIMLWAGSIWIPIFAHFINNAVSVILYYLYHRNILENDPEQFGTFNNIWVIWLSVFLSVTAFVSIYKLEIRRPVGKINIKGK